MAEKCYVQLVSNMRTLYRECRLVHGDLSEYNTLLLDDQLFIIDVSQSVEHDHPMSLDFLRSGGLHLLLSESSCSSLTIRAETSRV